MKKIVNTFNNIEEKLIFSLDLLEIAKNYCEYNSDENGRMNSLSTLLDIVIKEQKNLADEIDEFI